MDTTEQTRPAFKIDDEVFVVNVRGLEGTRHGEGRLIEIRDDGVANYRCALNKGFHSVRVENLRLQSERGHKPKMSDPKCKTCGQPESSHDENSNHEFERAPESEKPKREKKPKADPAPESGEQQPKAEPKPKVEKKPKAEPKAKAEKKPKAAKTPKQQTADAPAQAAESTEDENMPSTAARKDCKQCGRKRAIKEFRIAHGRPLNKCRECEREDSRKRAKAGEKKAAKKKSGSKK